MPTVLEYFGTDLDRAGHYFFTLESNYFGRPRRDFGDCPFNPERLPYTKKGIAKQNGATGYYQFAGFTIYAIEGSCYDKRPSSKSVFFTEELLSEQEMKHKILSTPIAKQIIEKMPFTIMWQFNTQNNN